ncbi:zinc-binding dehydrogenase [Streptomyces sp. NPDC004232]|uniref:quinone oxidoreductase family protein n=1 Tax=Streptomyces sp. NPDC004232 TaxID=3154454 RepID=UPI001DACAA3A|nr:zinc-binding dehydrogenase [Streptomyces sp. tea 10]
MRIVRYHAFGPSGVLRIEEAQTPRPGPGDVLVRVEAIGVDQADVQRRRGEHPVSAPVLPACPAADVVGVVEQAGPDVSDEHLGRRVVVWKARDAYADYVTAPLHRIIPVPDGLDPAQATVVGSTGRVAMHVVDTGQLRAGESVLVHGAAGAVGHMALQIAKARGAHPVIATASSPEKLDFARSLGADVGVDYSRPDWAEQVRRAVDGPGVDVILDGVGGELLHDDVELLAPYGRLVFYGASGSPTARPALPFLDVLGMKYVTGFSMATLLRHRPDLAESGTRRLLDAVAGGAVRPVVAARVPLLDVARAHDLVESRTSRGRVVLVP